jgi:DNA-binding transcriptional LysR family regulator
MQECYRCVMNFKHIRAFVTVAEVGSFVRAANRLNLSQPALSRQIHAMESDLGVRLFDRMGRRVQLTSEGEDLLRRSRRLLAEADSLGERARMLKGGDIGILRVGATPQVIETVLAPFLTTYRRRHPGVEVHLVEDGGVRLDSRLENGDVHLALTPAGARSESKLLYPMHVLAVLPPKHRMAQRRALELADLADQPLLLLRRDFGSRDWFDSACDVAHIQPRVLLESSSPQTLISLAATGFGLAIIPSNARLPRSGVRVVPVIHRGVSVGKWAVIAWHAERFLAPYAAQFVEEIVAHCQREYPGRDLIRRAPALPKPKPKTA